MKNKSHKPQSIDGMVDVSGKEVTKRIARASGRIQMTQEAFKALIEKGSPKGDVFETAKIAGIMAAKSTPRILPLCHPLDISKVKITFQKDLQKASVLISAEVVSLGRTGVEMEALTCVCASALTIYDMMKWMGQKMVISDIKLDYKSGGKSGVYESR